MFNKKKSTIITIGKKIIYAKVYEICLCVSNMLYHRLHFFLVR